MRSRPRARQCGLYDYSVKITPPTLIVKSLKPTPKAPKAGLPFTLRLVAARSDTGAAVQNGRVTCIGRVGNARLKAQVQRVQGGAAVCTWNLPPTAKGKSFRGSVAVAFEGLKASQSLRREGSLVPPPVRRLALLVSLLVVVATTGTAAGSIDQTPRSVVEQALLKVRPAPDLSGFRPNRQQPRPRRS